ncbi:MAG: hypothetical protein Q8M99_12040 [Methylotenera sp.]|nr:hypothetical protein [Methylotenera sp.]
MILDLRPAPRLTASSLPLATIPAATIRRTSLRILIAALMSLSYLAPHR